MWRLLVEHGVNHHSGLAVDDAITQSAAHEGYVTLRLYTYQLCVLVGRFQNVEDHVHLSQCRNLGISINRRPSGGGTIMMGPEQLGIALVVPPDHPQFSIRSTDLIHQCAEGLSIALLDLGIKTSCRGKNDLVAEGRKIAGLGLYQSKNGGKLFHASLLLDLDIQLMLQLLRTPFENFQDQGFSTVVDRISTIKSLKEMNIGMTELIETVKLAYEEQFSVLIEPGELKQSEHALAQRLNKTQYSTDKWIYQNPSFIQDRVGSYQIRTSGGNLSVKALVSGGTIKSVFLNGDFITSENAIYDLENKLRWHNTDRKKVRQTIDESYARNRNAWNKISADDLMYAIDGAVKRSSSDHLDSIPNPCFAREYADIS